MVKSVVYVVCSSIGKPNCFWPKISFLKNIVHEHDCWHHWKSTCLVKDSVFWNGYDVVIVPELGWLCWKNKGMDKSGIQSAYWAWIWASVLTSSFIFLCHCALFHGGIQHFIFGPYWKCQASSLLTVFSSEYQIVSRVFL